MKFLFVFQTLFLFRFSLSSTFVLFFLSFLKCKINNLSNGKDALVIVVIIIPEFLF